MLVSLALFGSSAPGDCVVIKVYLPSLFVKPHKHVHAFEKRLDVFFREMNINNLCTAVY